MVAAVFDDLARDRGERGGVALERAVGRIVLVSAVDERERDLEHDEHRDDDRQVREEKATPHGSRSLKPTVRTVSISVGSPSFLRNDATCTSSVLVGPYQCGSHTSSM